MDGWYSLVSSQSSSLAVFSVSRACVHALTFLFPLHLCVFCLSLCILSLFCPPPVLITLMGCICPPGSLSSPVYLQDSVFPRVFDSSLLYIVWSVRSCSPLWTDVFVPLCRSIYSFSLLYLFRLLGHFVPCRPLCFNSLFLGVIFSFLWLWCFPTQTSVHLDSR